MFATTARNNTVTSFFPSAPSAESVDELAGSACNWLDEAETIVAFGKRFIWWSNQMRPFQMGFDRVPSAFAVVSPSQIRGDAMVKVEGAAPFAEPELSSTAYLLLQILRKSFISKLVNSDP